MTTLSPDRVGRITGSRVAGILGLSPYTDRAAVLRQMVRERLNVPSEFTGNIATEWGKQNEPAATAEYERYRGVMVHSDQSFVIHRSLDYLGCTPDGLIGETGMVEIKCPFRAGYNSIDERPDYAAQIQLQLEVLDREWCDFVVWRTTGLSVSRVGRDPGWLPANLSVLDAFIAEYEDVIHDTESDQHGLYLEDTETIPVRDDFDWQMAALEFLEARAAADRAAAARDAARDRLVNLAAGEPAKGAGVSVSVTERSGSVDYKAAVTHLLPGRELGEYRRPSTMVTTVRATA